MTPFSAAIALKSGAELAIDGEDVGLSTWLDW